MSRPHCILLFLLSLFLYSCQNGKNYIASGKNTNLAPIEQIETESAAWHLNDTVTRIYFQMQNTGLLYKRTDSSTAFYARVRLFYKLTQEGGQRILDSGTVFLTDKSESELVDVKVLPTSFDLRATPGTNYIAEFEIVDVNRRTRYVRGINIQKTSETSDQNFLLLHRGKLHYTNYVKAGDTLTILTKRKNIPQLIADVYKTNIGPAPPPFSTRQRDEWPTKADSSYVAVFDAAGQTTVVVPGGGLLHLRPSPISNSGLTLLVLEPAYPNVGSAETMVASARYVMNKEEYQQCLDSKEKKAAIDKFWTTLAGNNDRAREMIRRYYGRVTEANKFFTSYCEGWKTDRGLIFIIYGPPTNTYRSKRDEVWVYGNEANPSSLRFVFNKVQNNFSQNDFVMERSPFYRDVFHSAVDVWRQGHILNDR
jgi:GWxTD domain-containing protein